MLLYFYRCALAVLLLALHETLHLERMREMKGSDDLKAAINIMRAPVQRSMVFTSFLVRNDFCFAILQGNPVSTQGDR